MSCLQIRYTPRGCVITLLIKEISQSVTKCIANLLPGPPRGRGGATGAIYPGPHYAKGPILTNVTSIMQFSVIDSYPCMFILINKLHVLTLQSLVHSNVY